MLQSREWISRDRTEDGGREPWREITKAENREVAMKREVTESSEMKNAQGLITNRMRSPRGASIPVIGSHPEF